MAKTNWQDPKTSEMRSTHVSGLMEAVGKIEDSIGMESVFETNVPLTEVFISSDDRYRIFQAPEGKRNWTAEQAPVIKRNGVTISSGFEIDYGGGAIVLNVNDTVANTYTADVKYIKKFDDSLIDLIKSLEERVPDDFSGSPGSEFLVAGDLSAGYFGTVPASELFTGTQLSAEVGISQGTIQFDDTPWLKFVLDGKILFRPMKAFRHSISWSSINTAGCVFGTKTVTKNGHTYKVRLMKTGLVDPMPGYDGAYVHGSEWNRLMLPIHIQAKDKSWAYPDNVEANVPYWGIDFTDEDLAVITVDGRCVWCQEAYLSARLYRGNRGVSYSNYNPPTSATAVRGWAPVLEWVAKL